MRHAERVIHRRIAPRDQFLGKSGIVFFFLFMETQIFQKEHVARTERRLHGRRFRADGVICKLHRAREKRLQMRRDLCKRQLRLHFALRPPHVARQDKRRALFQQIPQRRKRRGDAAVVLDRPVRLMRHIVIDADVDDFSRAVQIVNCLFHLKAPLPRHTPPNRKCGTNSPIHYRTKR